ncbi:T6SS immunity protein Tli4 family protein [Luteimonas sp. R10]|uniref:T6SS immunity protein Tli4 family protein n=1 Tax=Luteimonas sp. R10 TaxID=3108176 RepID=UPI003087FD55|nr:T6SS immunity protein Tli4 family protein [Luteimonas sp. R10]
MSPIPLSPVCIGRMLVDVPTQAEFRWVQETDVRFTRVPAVTQPEFESHVLREEELLRAKPHRIEGSLLSEVKVPEPGWRVLFHRNNELDQIGHRVRGYAWRDGVGYAIDTVKYDREQFSEVAATLTGSIPRLVPIDNARPTSIPSSGPGFCIDGALADPVPARIMVGVSIESFGWKGVSIGVGTSERLGKAEKTGGSGPLSAFDDFEEVERGYRERMKYDDEDAVESFDRLRKREVAVGGIPGQETAYKVETRAGSVKYGFAWKSLPQESSPVRFSFQLEAGADEYVLDYAPPPEATDLFALWDAMLASLRQRPGAY